VVLRVKLEGLKIVRSRGKYYVYHRHNGEAILRGFDGDKDALARKLSEPATLGAYNGKRKREMDSYADGSLGALVHWFKTQCPAYADLSDTTRDQYDKAFAYLEPEFDSPLSSITQPALYETRDICVKQKWGSFADKMMVALSSMFGQAVKRGKMGSNPALGMDKAYKRDPNKNREWAPYEWQAVQHAPQHIMIPMILARYAGYRGQTISKMLWSQYQPDPQFGMCFRITVRKNKEQTWIPAVQELQTYLAALPRTSTSIATRYNGMAWETESQMRSQVSHWLKEQERLGIVAPGVTLHGLRATYAAAHKRDGANDSEVAAALGDRTTRMGEHYSRHVEAEAKVIRAFNRGGK
jgi:hypothetical protein